MRKKLRELLREIDPAVAEVSDEAREEIDQLYQLMQTDQQAFGYRLLELARDVRASYPELMERHDGYTYEASFFKDVVPDLAVRLGVPREELHSEEGKDMRVTASSDEEFRFLVGVYLRNVSALAIMSHGREHLAAHGGSERDAKMGLTVPAAILVNNIANGNPVAFGTDRVCPPPAEGQDQDDFVASTIRSVSANRGFERTAEWSPELQNYPAEPEIAPGVPSP